MKRMCMSLAILAFCSPVAAQDCVVLLHGMGRSDLSMKKMERELSKSGFRVVNYRYPSTKASVRVLASSHLPEAITQCGDSSSVNFVTHSLGGIIVRQFLKENEIELLGRVVMLGPPNKGSEVVDVMQKYGRIKYVLNHPVMQLTTQENSVPNSIGSVDYPVGVIAGTSTTNPVMSGILPGEDDGKVTVERTKLEGMSDHLVLPVSHFFLMRDREVIHQVQAFLRTGAFSKQ